jgi:hypothetical protein
MPGTDLKLYDIAQPRFCENGLANEVVSIVGQKKQRVHALAASSAVCVPLIDPSPGHASGTNDAGTHGDRDIASPSRSEGQHHRSSVGPFLQDSEALIGACQAPEIEN